MNKEERIKSFFKVLKISLKNYSIYDEDHPSIKQSIENLHSETEKLSAVMDDSLKIGFTPDTLIIGSERLEGENLYKEIAEIFHYRKIKSLEIKPAVTPKELEMFLSKVYLPRKDLFEKGGLKKILEQNGLNNIKVEELDYSQLLKGDSREIKDIWTYLLLEADEEKNEDKMNYLAENYEKVHDKIDVEDVISDEILSGSFTNFFSYLSENKKDKYISCSKKLMKSVIKNKSMSSEEKLNKLKPLLTDLSEKDLASSLWEEISSDEDFDEVSFSIFSKLVEKEKHGKIAESLMEVFQSGASDESDAKANENIKELLTGTSNPLISGIYRNSLQALLKDFSDTPEKIGFNETRLQKNYHLMLLNMLDREKNAEAVSQFLNIVLEEWENIKTYEDFKYLRNLFEFMNTKKSGISSLENFRELEAAAAEYIEESILNGELSIHFNYFIEHMEQSKKDKKVYMEKIFQENIATPYILKAFFHFFSEDLSGFYAKLNQKSGDDIFLKKVIESLGYIDTPVSLRTLKYIFKNGNNMIRHKVLKAMESLTERDEKFLLPLIKKKEYDLKKQAFVLLSRNESTQSRAVNQMFSRKSLFSFNSKKLSQNIQIMDELDVRSSEWHLAALSQKRFFWNKSLRKQAQEILRKWDERKTP